MDHIIDILPLLPSWIAIAFHPAHHTTASVWIYLLFSLTPPHLTLDTCPLALAKAFVSTWKVLPDIKGLDKVCIVSSPKNKVKNIVSHQEHKPFSLFWTLCHVYSETASTRGQNEFMTWFLQPSLKKNSSPYERNFSCVKEGSDFRWCQGSSYIHVEPPKLSRKHPTQLLKQYSHKRAIITSSLEVRNSKVSLWKFIWILLHILNRLTYPSDIFVSFFMIKTIIIHMSKVKYTRNQQSVHWPFSTKHMTLKRLQVDL